MSYALEHVAEFERLEKQSELPAYDYESELSGLQINDDAVVLDAGCGSGIVSRYLATRYPTSQVIACDLSMSLLDQARKAANSIDNLTFESQDLTGLSYGDDSFDLVLSRYVIEHQTPNDVNRLIAELVRVLKPGGTLVIVDVDGHMFNLYPQSPCVRYGLERFIAAEKIDLYIGRKIPYLLSEAGLISISWRIDTVLFRGWQKEAEMNLMRDRFKVAEAFFEEVLGGKENAQAFQREYLECMEHPQAVSFSNKFIVSAVKPTASSL